MPATYDPIATTTLGANASTITFSSIPSTYTDLRLVLNIAKMTSNTSSLYVIFNNDSALNYGYTLLGTNGSTVSSFRDTSSNIFLTGKTYSQSSTIPNFATVDIFSYAGSQYKTCLNTLSNDLAAGGALAHTVGVWLSTSAINRVDFKTVSNFATGTTATLYGILRA